MPRRYPAPAKVDGPVGIVTDRPVETTRPFSRSIHSAYLKNAVRSPSEVVVRAKFGRVLLPVSVFSGSRMPNEALPSYRSFSKPNTWRYACNRFRGRLFRWLT